MMLLALLQSFHTVHASQDHALFPVSTVIKLQTYFWKRVYTDFSINEGILHDRQLILPIYERIPLQGLSPQAASQLIKKRKSIVAKQLNDLAKVLETNQRLSFKQQELLKKFYKGVTPKVLRSASKQIRFQRGLMEKFRESISRSGAYLPYFRKVFKKRGLPEDLVYLPHVESSFNPMAISRSGAVGVWQFMPPTGAEFMTVSKHIDERRDPWIAAESAAKLLQRNYDALRSWPLAITAYNYGHNGLKRIVKRMGSSDLGYLIRYYHNQSFRFAAKNFYAEFLAAREVAKNYQKYFGQIQFEKPTAYRLVRIPYKTTIHDIARRFSISTRKISEYNLAFQDAILKGSVKIPKNYTIRLPLNAKKYLVSNTILVKKGDTLYSIARECGYSLGEFQSINQMNSDNIYPGQLLKCRIPQKSQVTQTQTSQSLIQRLRKASKPSQVSSQTAKTFVVVQKGDTLYSLARRHQIDIKELMLLNRLEKNTIYPGQKIIVKSS